jgi:aspartate racemase
MRTIGIVGGMSWESSAAYYKIINQEVSRRLGGDSSARVVVNSTNFADVIAWHRKDDWASVEAEVTGLAQGLERAGAECWLIACVTQHEVADAAAKEVSIPFLHIADVTGEAVAGAGLKSVGLLGTRFTMERQFFTGRLRGNFGLDVLLPTEADREYLHRTIFEEFARGVFEDRTRKRYVEIINDLVAQGAEGIILGCTEIPLLVGADDVPGVPLFDTTSLHALAAVEFSLGGSGGGGSQ